ncbi:hypothetical protein DY000_02061204 [Brassica cretica]|uniref:Replication factor A C-terminal domain-containing protein n=1 Tax=Brassica cretica TaxID=69181 RepID=A0ABQ7B1K5_BRACR|nr:hypothetical protein DY000_02061204 [Brassica cretica]
MNSNSKNSVSGDLLSKKPNGKDAVSSTAPVKPSAAPVKPSAAPMKHIGQSGVSGDSSSKKRNGKAVVCSDVPSDKNDGVFFKNVTFGPQEDELRFRLIHFWEARNALSKILIGLEMLLIDEEGTVIQGFIPPSRIDTYLRHMFPGSTYRLNNFFGSKTKKVYQIDSVSMVMNSSKRLATSEGICMTLNESLVLDEVEIASMRRILVHVQTYDGPVMKLYIWDKAAIDFCEKFKSLGKPQSMLVSSFCLINLLFFGMKIGYGTCALSLSSLSSPRVFFDMDVQPTREYLAWLESNSEVANRVNAEIVTKTETATIGELLSYMKQEEAKVNWFECTATIDDVVRDSAWYYIACGGCKTKATKGPTTLMCKKCGKTEITGAADDVGHELTGKKASGLVESYYETNEGAVDGHVVPVSQALIDTIGQTCTFVIKISNHNLEGKTQALTVTKVLPLEVPVLGCDLDDIVVVPPTAVTLETGNGEEGSSIVNEEHADDGVKRGSDMIVSDDAKRAKCG